MALELLGRLGSGQPVYDRPNSHIHEAVRALLPEAFARILLQGDHFGVQEVDFDRLVGKTTGVTTNDADEIVYAQRQGRVGLTRFVKNRQPEPTSKVSVILKKDDHEDYYVLITAFVGGRPEPEPWDRSATEASRAFWSSHALVWGSEPVVLGTETEVPPQYFAVTANPAPRRGQYLAVVLDEPSRAQLRERFGGDAHERWVCHHLTVAFQPSEEELERYISRMGETVALSVVGYARDEKGQAIFVQPPADLGVKNAHPHVTLSCAKGVPPVYSNQLLAGGCRPLEPFEISGMLSLEG